MVDGSTFTGEIGCGLTPKLENGLNNDSSFVEIVDENKNRKFLAKSQIISVEPIKVERTSLAGQSAKAENAA